VNLPIAALVAIGTFTMIPKRAGNSGVRLDIPGTILGCGGLVAIVYGLGEAAADGWSSSQVVVPLIVAVVALSLFALVQSKVSSPLLPLRILMNRNRAGSFLGIVLAVLGMFGTFLFLTYLLQNVDHFSPLKTGVLFLPLMATNGLAATQLASRLMPHLRTRLLVVPGLLLAAVGLALLSRVTPQAAYVSHVLPTELLLGLGLGIAMVPLISTATNNAEPRDVGITSAATNTSQQVGASVGTALLNTIAATASAAYLATHVRHPGVVAQATVHGFAIASWWAAGSLVLAAVVTGILIDAHPGQERRQTDLAVGEGGRAVSAMADG
jgi:predicted MFS family arabinose efflux permease